MGDTREASRPRMSPQWEMVFARFDDLANQVARIESARVQDGRENRAEFQELRDQIQRTRDEVAHGVAQTAGRLEDEDSKIVAALDGIGDRGGELEASRKKDVRQVFQEETTGVMASAVRRAPGAAWAGLSWPSKTGAIVGGLTVIGTMAAAVVDALPKFASLIWTVIEALARPPAN